MAAIRPMAGLTSGKKILLKTMAAASEYSWKSMNSMAVPSQPETAALVRSRVVRVATPPAAACVLSVIGFPPVQGSDLDAAGGQRGQVRGDGVGQVGEFGQVGGADLAQ